MLAKIAIDRDGRLTHVRVLRTAYSKVPNANAINAQAVDLIK